MLLCILELLFTYRSYDNSARLSRPVSPVMEVQIIFIIVEHCTNDWLT